jgi:hypothetical protein
MIRSGGGEVEGLPSVRGYRAVPVELIPVATAQRHRAGSLVEARAAGEPLIPAALNNVIGEIRPGMTRQQVEALLVAAYPGVSSGVSLWSGQSGYVAYKLDDRYTLSVASAHRVGDADRGEVVHDDLLFFVFDYQTKQRVDLKRYYWDEPSGRIPAG